MPKLKGPKTICPISYPGGKSKMVKNILSPLFPEFSGDFYDAFIGGGSIPLWVSQMYPEKNVFVNDLNEVLYNFWNVLSKYPNGLIDNLTIIRDANDPEDLEKGKQLLKRQEAILYNEKSDDLERASAYFTLNKIAFSGLTEHGSLSKSNYKKKFNLGNIQKLSTINSFMENWKLFNYDYETFLKDSVADDFVFLDPPYDLGEKNNTLYGKMGEMHKGFDHDRFAEVVKKLPSKWMITYNDNEEIRARFRDYIITDQEYRYFMTFKEDEKGNKKTRKKNELIITNY